MKYDYFIMLDKVLFPLCVGGFRDVFPIIY